MKQWNWKYIIIFILAIPVVNHLAEYLGRSAAQQVNERDAASSPAPNFNQDIRVVAFSQDSEGATQRKFDLNFLKNLEAHIVERVKLKTKEYLASQGQPNANVDFTSEATYFESGSKKVSSYPPSCFGRINLSIYC